MLDFIRSQKRLFMGLLLLLILPSFVVVGAWDLIPGAGRVEPLAEVNGQPITREALDAAHEQNVANLRAQFGNQLPADLADSPALRQQTLEQLVEQLLVDHVIREAGLAAPQARVLEFIQTIPEFQVDGQFSKDQARSILAQQGLSEDELARRLASSIAEQSLLGTLSTTPLASAWVSSRLADAESEERRVQFQRLDIANFRAEAAKALTTERLQAIVDGTDATLSKDPAVVTLLERAESADIQLLVLKTEGAAAKADEFSALVYEQPQSLEPAAKALGLEIITVAGIGRQAGLQDLPQTLASDGRLALDQPALRAAIFNSEVLAGKQNTDSVEIRPGVYAAARVTRHEPAGRRPLAEVEGTLRELVTFKEAQQLARKAAESQQISGDGVWLNRRNPASSLQALGLSPEDPQAGEILDAIAKAGVGTDQPVTLESANAVFRIQVAEQRLGTALAADDRQAVTRQVRDLVAGVDRALMVRAWKETTEQALDVSRDLAQLETNDSASAR